MALSLTQEQRAKVRNYLGYFNLEQRAAMDLGVPVIVAQQGILENNMRLILDQYSLDIISDLIEQIDCSRTMTKQAKGRLKATEVANTVKMNRYELNQLWQEGFTLCLQLAQLLASPLYWHPTMRGFGVGYPGAVKPNWSAGGGGSIPLHD